MADILQRLRSEHTELSADNRLKVLNAERREAADEIEPLREEIRALHCSLELREPACARRAPVKKALAPAMRCIWRRYVVRDANKPSIAYVGYRSGRRISRGCPPDSYGGHNRIRARPISMRIATNIRKTMM